MVGSSSISTSGSSARAQAMDRRFFQPPDRLLTCAVRIGEAQLAQAHAGAGFGVQPVGRGGGHPVDDGRVGGGVGLEHIRLTDVGQPQLLTPGQVAVVGVFEPGQDLEQRGLARAVGPDEPQPLAVVDGDGHALEELVGAVGLGQVGGVEEGGHGGGVGF